MLPENHKYKRFRCLLWLIFLSGQCFFVVNANVAVQSLTQSPDNPVADGSTVTYSVTVSNSGGDADISINMVSGSENIKGKFSPLDCRDFGEVFGCGLLNEGAVRTYRFTATAFLQDFPSPITFIVDCSETEGCTGESRTVSPNTEIIPEPPPTTELNFASGPGTTVSATFTVKESSSSSISAVLGSVAPANLPAGGGEATYSFDIPLDAVIGEKITDTIIISFDSKGDSQIPVTITVSPNLGDTPGLTDGEKAVAVVLSDACAELRLSDPQTEGQENLLDICNQVDSADPATKLSMVQQITPAQVPAQTDLSV